MFPVEFTEKELNAWLDTLDIPTSYAIIEKLHKDMRDYAVSLHQAYMANQKEEDK